SGITQWVPQSVGREQCINETVAMFSYGVFLVCHFCDRSKERCRRGVAQSRFYHLFEQLVTSLFWQCRNCFLEKRDRFSGEIGFERVGNDLAVLRVLGAISRHGKVPVRHRHTGTNILKCLLEFVEINAVPGKKAFPSVLTMVLMDEGHV